MLTKRPGSLVDYFGRHRTNGFLNIAGFTAVAVLRFSDHYFTLKKVIHTVFIGETIVII